MDEYKVVQVPIDSLVPYEKNAKKHPKEQVDQIAESIRQFGFRQNLVIDQHNVVIVGHGRLLAARKLGLERVPCVRIEDLTPEQIKALRLADNRVAESDWDDDLLSLELDDLPGIDMSDFGFDVSPVEENTADGGETEDEDELRYALRQFSFENQEIMQFDVDDNIYGIPSMRPTQTWGDKLIRFCDLNKKMNVSDYILHFYCDDYKFMQVWRNPEAYVEQFKKFKAVISPNFSLYTDFPRALQILSCYRRQWCGAFWQEMGIDVIPNVAWGEESSFEFCFAGIPKHSVVSVSTVGVRKDANWDGRESSCFIVGYNEMMRRLEPTKIIFYGAGFEGLEGDIVYIPTAYQQRMDKLLERRKRKNGNSI